MTVPTFDAGRYWEVPFIDAYTNVNSYIGSHYNNTAGSYLVVGPVEISNYKMALCLVMVAVADY